MSTSPDYLALKSLLEKRLSLISDTKLRVEDPGAQLIQLQQVSEDIAHWQKTTKAIPQQLNHFLLQSSLNKALEFISKV